MLKRFQVDDCTPVDTPCEANLHLAASDSPPLDKRNAEVVRNYQQLIRACMYLTCFTRGTVASLLINVPDHARSGNDSMVVEASASDLH